MQLSWWIEDLSTPNPSKNSHKECTSSERPSQSSIQQLGPYRTLLDVLEAQYVRSGARLPICGGSTLSWRLGSHCCFGRGYGNDRLEWVREKREKGRTSYMSVDADAKSARPRYSRWAEIAITITAGGWNIYVAEQHKSFSHRPNQQERTTLNGSVICHQVQLYCSIYKRTTIQFRSKIMNICDITP